MITLDFEQWFESFWTAYDKKYTDGIAAKKGPKGLAKKAAQRHVKTAEQADLILKALEKQKAFWDCARVNEVWMPNFPHVATWFNQERWTIEIDEDIKPRVKLPDWTDNESWRRLGESHGIYGKMGEGWNDYKQRVKERLK